MTKTFQKKIYISKFNDSESCVGCIAHRTQNDLLCDVLAISKKCYKIIWELKNERH